jgi:hypothetical protein
MKFIITEEQNEKLNQKVKSMVNRYGVKETLRLFDDNVDIIRRAYLDNPSDFLNQFNDLSKVEKDGIIYYVDKDRSPLFHYYPDDENGYVYINYSRIWSFFSNVIGLKHEEIKGIMNNWLEKVYNLKGLTPRSGKIITTFSVGRDL